MGWHFISLKNYKKDHCSLTLQNKTKQTNTKQKKSVSAFHLEEQVFLNLSFPPWTFNFKKQIATAIIKGKPLWFMGNDLPEENL